MMVLERLHDQLVESVHLRDGGLSFQQGQLVYAVVVGGGNSVTGKALVFMERIPNLAKSELPKVVVVKLRSLLKELLV